MRQVLLLTVFIAEVVLPEPDGDGVHGAGDLRGEDAPGGRGRRQDRHLLLPPKPLAIPNLKMGNLDILFAHAWKENPP